MGVYLTDLILQIQRFLRFATRIGTEEQNLNLLRWFLKLCQFPLKPICTGHLIGEADLKRAELATLRLSILKGSSL